MRTREVCATFHQCHPSLGNVPRFTPATQPDDVKYIASERAKRKKRKLKRAWVGACHSMATKYAIDAWLGLVNTVGGYTGLSAGEWGISSPSWFDRSPKSDPNPQAGIKADPKNRKGGKTRIKL